MDKGEKDKLVRSPGKNGGQVAQKNLHSRSGSVKTKGKTQERTERGSRKRSSSAGSEQMERVGDRFFWDRGGTVVKALCYKSEGR